jgi:hypothetical protein
MHLGLMIGLRLGLGLRDDKLNIKIGNIKAAYSPFATQIL